MSSKGLPVRRIIGLGLLISLLLTSARAASPGLRSGVEPPPSARLVEGKGTAADSGERCIHVVRRGDSIRGIAARYGTTPGALISANRLGRAKALEVSQRLAMPGCNAARRVPERTPLGSDSCLTSHSHSGMEFVWPVEGPVTSRFGRRGFWGWHRGVDIKAARNTPIRAAASGTVLFSGWQSSYGRVIRIAHPGALTTVYAHNLRNLVKAGDRVGPETIIGAVGRTGFATGYHLHFEIQRAGLAENPLPLLAHREPAPVMVAHRSHVR